MYRKPVVVGSGEASFDGAGDQRPDEGVGGAGSLGIALVGGEVRRMEKTWDNGWLPVWMEGSVWSRLSRQDDLPG